MFNCVELCNRSLRKVVVLSTLARIPIMDNNEPVGSMLVRETENRGSIPNYYCKSNIGNVRMLFALI